MPKKTKKEKILAEIRRKNSLLREASPNSVKNQISLSSSSQKTTSPVSFTYKKEVDTKLQKPLTVGDFVAFKQDLLKITLFTFSALIFQGVLYFLLKKP